MRHLVTPCLICTATATSLFAAEPVTLENAVEPASNTPDEAFAESFSFEQGVHFLDSAALSWQKKHECFTCHTNYAYLYVRPMISFEDTAHRQVREFAEQLVTEHWPDHGPRWDAEVVASATALAFNDSRTTGKLHPATRTALDRMWTIQREDGGWNWLDCDWPPFEDDDEYGVCLAALAVSVAPDDYSQTPDAVKGVEGIQRYLAENSPPTLHHRGLLLWASNGLNGLRSDSQNQATVDDLLDRQNEDGGWGLPSLGEIWKRENGEPQDETSDGYGTGFTIFILRQAAVPAEDERIRRGIRWLKANQRTSGRWFTRSLKMDSEHFISHAGTAFAMMALCKCGER